MLYKDGSGIARRGSYSRIGMAKQYINENYARQLPLKEVAEAVDLNTSYFSNFFKLQTGKKYTDYLLDVRMSHAIELLRDPRTKIYEIGILVGYEDVVSFGRAFRRRFNMSPRQYRERVLY
ncbi:helix-turn-helix domain-containing protein [Butyrivibrio sp. JL13D10]|uniref:helix-turn-helix domain-containing protein n=1 Tax=Butyrivibrio sp. JL13D10 TaxID=3236815 RepID=UPI0038B5ED83